MSQLLTPAAQYLRVSTEKQQYSIENQRAGIEQYAIKNGFRIVRTYIDQGKSGLSLNNRNGLQGLLSEVVQGRTEFKAILAYDVTRWGRFQDADEAAHYEFLCRSAGVNIHYCVEQFAVDNSLPNSLMKTLKRVMAAEYSRELSDKVHEGSKKVAKAGFRTGGVPGYGLRRMLVSASGHPKHLLAEGERKSLQSDRVILVPGPEEEVACIRTIFSMFLNEQKWPTQIAAELRERDIRYAGATRNEWYAEAIGRILRNPKYCGASVFGRSHVRLGGKRKPNAAALWTVRKNAWVGIVDQSTFDEVQERFRKQTAAKTNDVLLAALQQTFIKEGRLSGRLVSDSSHLPSIGPFVRRFGSLSEAFERVGFISPWLMALQTKRRLSAIRTRLLQQIVSSDPQRVSLFQLTPHHRARLVVLGQPIAVYVCRCEKKANGQFSWSFAVNRTDRGYMSLVIRPSWGYGGIVDMFLVSDIQKQTRYTFALEGVQLAGALAVDLGSPFAECVQRAVRLSQTCDS
jgi:DNA invertase Pin-like site-specific DNA recombinase